MKPPDRVRSGGRANRAEIARGKRASLKSIETFRWSAPLPGYRAARSVSLVDEISVRTTPVAAIPYYRPARSETGVLSVNISDDNSILEFIASLVRRGMSKGDRDAEETQPRIERREFDNVSRDASEKSAVLHKVRRRRRKRRMTNRSIDRFP